MPTYEMHGVVVVPEQASRLLIGVVVVLVFARLGDVFCPAVKGSTRVGPMEMDGVLGVGVVDKTDNRLSSPRNDESWSWRHAIVANERSRAKIGVDRLAEGLDLQFIIPNLFASDRADYLPVELLGR